MSDIVRERAAVLRDFSGGLNNYWDPTTIAQNEVPYLTNLEFSPTGALTSRPPIWEYEGDTFPEASTHFNLLGYYVAEDGDRYGVFTSPTKTYIFDLDETWTQIWDKPAADFAQYQGYIIMCRIDGAGAYWGPDGAPRWTGTAWEVEVVEEVIVYTQPIATMPAGRGIELFQERLFLFGPLNSAAQSVMYWSNIAGEVELSPEQDWRYWDTNNNFTAVNSGDGQWITGLVTGYNEITIFRNASTFRFTFYDDVTQGTIAKVQDGIGAENQFCIARYENALIVLSGEQLYTYYNGIFQSMNDLKVRFEELEGSEDLKVRYAVSMLGSRAIVWYGGNTYVAQMKTGTWSKWESNREMAYCRVMPSPANNIDKALEAWAISASATSSKWKLWRICDHLHPDDGPEEMVCELRTRIYDFETPNEYKRLYWWAADIMGVGEITARVFPVSLDTSTQSTWDHLERFTWDELATSLDGWDNPAPFPFTVQTNTIFAYRRPERINLKLDHSLRFRRVYFEISMNCDGTAATAPTQIFSITPMIGVKAKTSERIS
jgi:hypothetical protein